MICTLSSGGGIGGLTLAVALGRCNDVDVDIYEQALQFAEIGAGIAVLPRAWDILQKLGLDGELDKAASKAPSDRPGTFHLSSSVSRLPDPMDAFLYFE